MTLIETLLHHTDGMSGVTFANDLFLRRLLQHTDGMSGVLASRIISEILSTITDYLGAQFNTYDLNIDVDPDEEDPGAKEAYEANIILLEGLLGFEPTEELLDCAIAARDHVCIPGGDVSRSGESMISAYRHVVQELNLFFGSNILQEAIDRGVELSPEFNDLMNAVMPVYRGIDVFGAALPADAGDVHSVFGGRTLLANLVLIFGGSGESFFKLNEKLPEGADDDLSLLMFQTGTNGFPITLDITLKRADGTGTVVNIVHPGDFRVEIDIDPPNKYISVELMKKVSGGLSLDSLIVLRKRRRQLPV